MHGIQRDEFAIKIEPCDELARGGDFIALVLHQFASEVMLGWRGDGGHDVVTAGVFGLLAIDGHHFVKRDRTADAPLPFDENLFDKVGIHLGHHAAEGGLVGRGAAAGLGVAAHAERLELPLREAFGENL